MSEMKVNPTDIKEGLLKLAEAFHKLSDAVVIAENAPVQAPMQQPVLPTTADVAVHSTKFCTAAGSSGTTALCDVATLCSGADACITDCSSYRDSTDCGSCSDNSSGAGIHTGSVGGCLCRSGKSGKTVKAYADPSGLRSGCPCRCA